ncbi:MAG: protein-L-isoaspartate O-methyltransferase [Candidatus Berkiella sp.]
MNFELARANMVTQQVRPWHVLDEDVLKVMANLQRELFVPKEFQALAYSDTDIPMKEGQTLLSPKVVGRALQAMAFTGDEKVLEIGTGTGYVTACLSQLAHSVVSVEIHESLLNMAEAQLAQLPCQNVTLLHQDGILGVSSLAPFDVIVVTGSFPLGVPEALIEQLKVHGRLFAVCGQAPTMQAVKIVRDQSAYQLSSLFETVVPSLINAKQPEKFEF